VEALRVARGWGSHIFLTIGSQMASRLSALHAGRFLPPGRFLVLISVRGWVNSGAMVRLGLEKHLIRDSNRRPSSCLLQYNSVSFGESQTSFRRNTRHKQNRSDLALIASDFMLFICLAYVPPKRRLTFNRLQDIIPQKIRLLITVAVRTWRHTAHFWGLRSYQAVTFTFWRFFNVSISVSKPRG
jgi:hypothetical protein